MRERTPALPAHAGRGPWRAWRCPLPSPGSTSACAASRPCALAVRGAGGRTAVVGVAGLLGLVDEAVEVVAHRRTQISSRSMDACIGLTSRRAVPDRTSTGRRPGLQLFIAFSGCAQRGDLVDRFGEDERGDIFMKIDAGVERSNERLVAGSGHEPVPDLRVVQESRFSKPPPFRHAAVKAERMRRPSSLRLGMFWSVGWSWSGRQAAIAQNHRWWMRPSTGLTAPSWSVSTMEASFCPAHGSA